MLFYCNAIMLISFFLGIFGESIVAGMVNTVETNFEFLKTEFPDLAEFGRQAKKYCYSDPSSCMMNLGRIYEYIINYMIKYHKVELSNEDSVFTRINKLKDLKLLDNDQIDIIHKVRKERNVAAHGKYNSVKKCKKYIDDIYGFCKWFIQKYGDRSVKEKKKEEAHAGWVKQAEAKPLNVQNPSPTFHQQQASAKASPQLQSNSKEGAQTASDIGEALGQIFSALIVLAGIGLCFWLFGGLWDVVVAIFSFIGSVFGVIWDIIVAIFSGICWLIGCIVEIIWNVIVAIFSGICWLIGVIWDIIVAIFSGICWLIGCIWDLVTMPIKWLFS